MPLSVFLRHLFFFFSLSLSLSLSFPPELSPTSSSLFHFVFASPPSTLCASSFFISSHPSTLLSEDTSPIFLSVSYPWTFLFVPGAPPKGAPLSPYFSALFRRETPELPLSSSPTKHSHQHVLIFYQPTTNPSYLHSSPTFHFHLSFFHPIIHPLPISSLSVPFFFLLFLSFCFCPFLFFLLFFLFFLFFVHVPNK